MGSIWLRLATEERMQNANLSQEISEEPGSRIPDMSTQLSPEPGFVPASIIERAAQRLDWTNPSGMQHSTPRGLEETTNQRPDPPRIAWASWLRSSRSGGPRLLLISRLYVSVLVVVVAGTGIFLLTHSADEKATSKSALATEVPAKTSEVRGLAIMPPAAGRAQSATLLQAVVRSAEREDEGSRFIERHFVRHRNTLIFLNYDGLGHTTPIQPADHSISNFETGNVRTDCGYNACNFTSG